MRIRPAILLALTLTGALVAVACAGNETAPSGGTPTESPTETGSPTPTEGGTVTIGDREANDHGSQDVSGQDEIDLELDDFYFEPTILQGQGGQQLQIELRNEGQAAHNFSLTEQGIDQDLEAGEDATVTVTFPESGILVFLCKFHEAQGMVGGLSV